MPQGSAASSKRSFIVRTRREIKCVEDEDEKRKTGNALSTYNRISPRKRIEDEYRARGYRGIDTGGRAERKVDLGMQYLQSTQPRSYPGISFMI